MYRYTEFDQRMVDERVAQFRDQVARWKQGSLSDEELRPLRLQNGLYIQRHAPMLRVAIPYGLLSAVQLRALARISRTWDRGYGHFSTRQNIQFNWLKIEDAPDVLAALAQVEMHAIQTSGNVVRNITTDAYAGVIADERVDPRPYCELMRQWSSFHPEFSFLPRKFKIAFSASAQQDRAVTALHDLGFYLHRAPDGAVLADVLAGGGMGRTPLIGAVIRRDLPCNTWPPTPKQYCASTTGTAGATTCTRRASRSWCARLGRRPSLRRSTRNLPICRMARAPLPKRSARA